MYSRETELRHVHTNDIYKLGVILDDNNSWKSLMEIIPKEVNTQSSSVDGALDWGQAVASGFKYTNDHIRLIENAIRRPGESRLFSEILFDEWGTSGRKGERPTVGVLLQLLVKAELYRAADFVATQLLKEPPPERPLSGPAARIDISLKSDLFNDIEDLVNDSAFYPATELLNERVNSDLLDNNKDFYTKYQCLEKKLITKDTYTPAISSNALHSGRQHSQQQRQQRQSQQQPANEETTTARAASNNIYINDQQAHRSMSNSVLNILNETPNAVGPNCNNTEGTADHSTNTESTNLSDASIPLIGVLGKARMSSHVGGEFTQPLDSDMNTNDVLPVISALNLNGEKDTTNADYSPRNHQRLSNTSSDCDESDDAETDVVESRNQDFEDDDEDSSVPNLSMLDQRSSNNDSSLTNVTGTSGENSFELSTNDSSTSNENIPSLSVLKP